MEQGNMINPNIELSPETINSFLEQAKSEIAPEFARQIDLIKENLGQNIQTLQRQFEIEKEATEEQFKRGIEDIGIFAAEKGFATSGIRTRQERELALGTGRALKTGALGLESQLRGLTGAAAGQIGSEALRTLPLPQFQIQQVSGLDLTRGRQLQFRPQTQISGALPQAQEAGIKARMSQLEAAQRVRQQRNAAILGIL